MSSNVLKFSSITSFVVSGLFTIMLMISGVVGIIATVLTMLIAIILELSKCSFFYLAIQGKINGNKIKQTIRIVCFIVALLLFFSSIIASLSFLQNNNNKSKNIAVESSQASKNKESNINSQSELIKTKKDEINLLKSTLKNTENQSKKTIDDLRSRNLITKANRLQKESQKSIEALTNKINNATNELSTMTSGLQNIINSKVDIDNTNTKGYSAFLNVIADNLNKSDEYKNNKWTVEEIETIFFGTLSVIFEIVAVLLFYFSILAKEKAEVKEDIEVVEKKQNIELIGNVIPINQEKKEEIAMKKTEYDNDSPKELSTGISKKLSDYSIDKLKNKIGFELPKQNINVVEKQNDSNIDKNFKQEIEKDLPKEKLIDTQIKKNISFIKIDGVSEQQIKLYLQIGFKFSKEIDGKIIFPGYSKISNESENKLSLKIARAINTVLGEKKITEIIQTSLGKRTIINYSKKELIGEE